MNTKLINKAVSKAGFGIMQITFGNLNSAILCFESAIKALKKALKTDVKEEQE